MMDRKPTRYDHLIYSSDWRAWKDPEYPAWFNPVEVLLARHVAQTPDRIAVIADGQSVTYAQLMQGIVETGSALSKVGVAPGERVLLFATDSLDYVQLWYACVHIGAIPAVVSDLYKAKELSYFIADTGAATLYIDEEQYDKLAEVSGDLPPSLQRVIVRGSARALPNSTVPVMSLAEIVAKADKTCPGWKRHSDDICYMFYSGGTTGTAKGITHLAYDFFLVPARHGKFWSYVPEDIVYATSRKYFTHGIWPGMHIPLSAGATLVIDRRPPSADVVCEVLQKWKVTKFITVPTIIKNMLEYHRTSDKKIDLSSVNFVASASEKIPPEVFGSFKAAFGVEIFDSIGSSEIAYEWIANRKEENKTGSLGKPIFGVEVRLVSAEGEDITEPNVPGECWIKSPTACFFYWRKYDKSRETFMGPWTRTGDSLMFDEDGFFWFNSRESDVFKVKGLWVSPIEIEAAITAHASVLEAAVVSFDDKDGFTKPRAYVVLKKGVEPNDALRQELCAQVRPLGGYKVPEDILFIDALPRTTLMKIDRRALRDRK